MKKLIYWSVCIAAVLMCFSWAYAQGRYDSLCDEANLSGEQVTAWLEIESAGFCQPVMQHPQDDVFYSGHDPYGEEMKGGCLFTQATYNARDFSDPVTIIYGSSSGEGTVFRDLQETYSGDLESNRNIFLHTPNGTQEYVVFAAVPYSAVHILHYYDFAVERKFTGFFDGVFETRLLGMQLAEEDRPETGDRVLILSTGLRGDDMQRYLVMAKLVTQ